MRVRDIKLLFEYNIWANARILAAAEKLSDEQLKAANDLGWGSLHGMLAHILDAEYGWRHYLADGEGVKWLGADDFADLAAIRERWAAENRLLMAYLDSLSDEALDGKALLRSRWRTAFPHPLALPRAHGQSRHPASQ